MRHLRALPALAAASLLATVPTTASAVPEPAATAQAKPNPESFELRDAKPDYMSVVRRLDGQLDKSGVQRLLGEANRTASTKGCNGTDQDAHEYCFEGKEGAPGDDQNTDWVPQGVTTVSDAVADEQWGSKKPVLASWYHDGGKKGVRVSFLDPSTKKYRHVLLAVPREVDGEPTYGPLSDDAGSMHAGGVAWYGNYLYVADTTGGLRVFDMRYIFDLDKSENGNTDDRDNIGRTDPWLGSPEFTGYGYRYVMPQVAGYVNDETGKCGGNGGPRFSFVSVDRSTRPDRLVTGEYCSGAEDGNGRVMTWNLDASTGKLRGSDGRYHADSAYRVEDEARRIQGAAAHGGDWYLTQTNNNNSEPHKIFRAKADEESGELRTVGDSPTGDGPEDLSYWNSSDHLWTLTENAGSRAIYSQRPPN